MTTMAPKSLSRINFTSISVGDDPDVSDQDLRGLFAGNSLPEWLEQAKIYPSHLSWSDRTIGQSLSKVRF